MSAAQSQQVLEADAGIPASLRQVPVCGQRMVRQKHAAPRPLALPCPNQGFRSSRSCPPKRCCRPEMVRLWQQRQASPAAAAAQAAQVPQVPAMAGGIMGLLGGLMDEEEGLFEVDP